MLSIGVMSAGQEEYYLGKAREDYYTNGGDRAGKWYGGGAKSLGLKGAVKSADLRGLFRGYSPAGRPLVRNAIKKPTQKAPVRIDHETGGTKRKKRRDPGWDLTFSVPKSVSVLWSQASEPLRKRLETIIEQAFGEAIAYMEGDAGYCRVGKGGKKKVPAKLVVSAFVHGTSRKLDPQYHIHALVLNAGLCPDGKYRALASIDLFRHKMAGGAFFRTALAHGLQSGLGVKLIRPLQTTKKNRRATKQSWFEIDGVPTSLMESFSKRRAEIKEKLGELRLESTEAAAIVAKTTRTAKGVTPPPEELFRQWQAEGRKHGFAEANIQKLLGRVKPSDATKQARRYQKALREAVEEITFSQSHFTRLQLLQKTLDAAQVWGLDADFVRSSIDRDLKNQKTFVELGKVGGMIHYSTPGVIASEKLLIDSVDQLHQSCFRPLKSKTVEGIIAAPRYENVKTVKDKVAAKLGLRGEGIFLNDEQAAALRYLTEAEGRVKFLNGLAGTGKTTLLSAMREAYERSGYRVLGCSVAGVAAQGLQIGAGIQSDTVRMLEKRLERSPMWEIKHHARQLVRAALHKRTYGLNRLNIDRRTVLVIDEAGMLGTREFAELARAVVKGGGILIGVGDHRQLPSIEAGGGFGFLTQRIGQVDMQDIGRQTDHLDREMVKAMVRGEADKVLRLYGECGRLKVSENQEQTAKTLIGDWKNRGGVECPKDHVIVVQTNREVERYNDLAQRECLLAGKLDVRHSARVGAETMYPGDRVIFTQKSRKIGVENGDRGVMTGVKPWGLGTVVAVKLDRDERTVFVPIQKMVGQGYEGLQRGYAFTTHKLQGATVKNSYIHVGGKMTSKEMAYVQASRHRDSLQFYTEKVEAGRELTRMARAYERKEERQQDQEGKHRKPSPLLHVALPSSGFRPTTGIAGNVQQGLPQDVNGTSRQVVMEGRKPLSDHQHATANQWAAGLSRNRHGEESAVEQAGTQEHHSAAAREPRQEPTKTPQQRVALIGKKLPDFSQQPLMPNVQPSTGLTSQEERKREGRQPANRCLHDEIEPLKREYQKVEQDRQKEAEQNGRQVSELVGKRDRQAVAQGQDTRTARVTGKEHNALQRQSPESCQKASLEMSGDTTLTVPVKHNRLLEKKAEVSPLAKQMQTTSAKTLAHEIMERERQRMMEEQNRNRSHSLGR